MNHNVDIYIFIMLVCIDNMRLSMNDRKIQMLRESDSSFCETDKQTLDSFRTANGIVSLCYYCDFHSLPVICRNARNFVRDGMFKT